MVLKDEVIAAVEARTPVDDRERDCIEQFLREIERLGDDPFDEHDGPVHVTTSALIAGPRGVVLHRHRLLGIWVAPGGHIDRGENPWDAAVREATEETGLASDTSPGAESRPHRRPCRPTWPHPSRPALPARRR
jgi:8-oxo-dGTP pyrophosphatase MutT (NUDIX family)